MQREETGPEGSSNFPRSPSPGSRPILVSPSVHSKCCPVPSTPPVHRQRPLHPRVGLRAVFPFSLLQRPRGEARDGIRARAKSSYPGVRALMSARDCAGGSPGPGAGSRGGKGGAGARARAGGHAHPAACAGARCRAVSMYGREGAAAGKAGSTPCAHAPAPAGYKAAAPAPPDKVANCDVTGRSCGCCRRRARRRARDTSGIPGLRGTAASRVLRAAARRT